MICPHNMYLVFSNTYAATWGRNSAHSLCRGTVDEGFLQQLLHSIPRGPFVVNSATGAYLDRVRELTEDPGSETARLERFRLLGLLFAQRVVSRTDDYGENT